VAVDVNWGIRFTESGQATTFLRELAQELSKRLMKNKAKGKAIVLKVFCY
jgi:DNA repair protein REV1